MQSRRRAQRTPHARLGVTMVEFAFCFPVFMIIMFGIFEFGRAYMVTQILNAAARQAARAGVTDDVTTADVIDRMEAVLVAAGINPTKVRYYIIDGSGFDENPNNPPSLSNMLEEYEEPFEIDTARARQLAIIRVEVDYNDVRLLAPRWLSGVTLYGQVIVRKE
jgi:fructose-specific component phosphotransferase system IIB-like protein